MRWTDYTNRILAELDYEAFYLGELHNVQRNGSELKAECPFTDLHESQRDENPSLTVNLSKGVYYCNTCHSKGNAHTLYKLLYDKDNEQAWYDLGDALKVPRPDSIKPTRPEIETGLVAQYHNKLMSLTGPIRKMLKERRGLTDDTLRLFQLGWDGERVTIPIYDEYNALVNFRRYKWNSDNDQWKVINYTDELNNTYGEVRIFGLDQLLDDTVEDIVWAEGELDRVIAQQEGFPSACPTSGAGTWRPEWSKYFKRKKRVYLCGDNDEAGRSANKKLCQKLCNVVDVYVVQWPDDFPVKGDITDFFVKCKQTREDFRALLDSAEKYLPVDLDGSEIDESESIELHLADSASAQYAGKRVKVPVMVSGKDGTPFICPKIVKCSCGDSASADNKKCQRCSLAAFGGEIKKEFSASDKLVMNLIKCTDKQQLAAIREALCINMKCEECDIVIEENMNIEELRLIPKAEANFGFSMEQEYVVRTGYHVGENMKTNKRYTMLGYMYPDPKTQYSTYVFDKAIPEKDMVSYFELSDEVLEQLQMFKLAPGQTIEEKFNDIHEDLERNVTYVWERRDVAFAVDLIYHTVLNFYFQDQFVKRGWGELLIIGDSGQAKTTLVERLMRHYGLGELHSGESSKRTGLVYSIQQTNQRWFLVWGAFPLNDGGLIVLDELSGLEEHELAIMSDVRSSGIAKTTGVITAETTARTRAIYISNPRNGRQLNTETYGCNAVLKLFGKAEDVRRLDLAMSVASGDVDPELINKDITVLPEVKHRYTSEACKTRVLWAWSRRPDDIIFEPNAVKAILKYASEMGSKYSSKVPIVEAADQRIKIARLAVATACCVFSSPDGQQVIVKEDHVKFVVDFMDRIYSTKSFGYDRLSEQDITASDQSDDSIKRLREQFCALPIMDVNEMARILYQLPYFSRAALEDYTGLARDDLKQLLKFLTNNNLVDRVKGDYRRLPLGTALLENLTTTKVTKDEIDSAKRSLYDGADF